MQYVYLHTAYLSLAHSWFFNNPQNNFFQDTWEKIKILFLFVH
jgi:hypothetical protein